MPHPRSRILFISPCWPVGHSFGGQLRALNTARALQAIGDVSILIVGSDASDTEGERLSNKEFLIESPVLPRLFPNRGLWNRLRWAVDVRYLNIHGYAATVADQARIRSRLDRFDLVWVLNSRTPSILQTWSWPRTHLDIDDLPSTYHRAVAASGHGSPTRWKAKIMQLLLYRRERCLSRRFTTISVCSAADRDYLKNEHAHIIPNGFERPALPPFRTPSSNPPRIGFVGLYSYYPNRDGVHWFLKHVWPLVRRAVPGVRFRLMGKDSDGPQRPFEPEVDCLGWVEDPSPEISTWSSMVVPIRVGGGTRIKIADAFSRKCPVVSTRFGAYGYDVEDRNQVRLADTPDEFAQACIYLIQDQNSASAMAERAWNDFLQKWTWDAIAPKVHQAAEDCLRRSGRLVAPTRLGPPVS